MTAATVPIAASATTPNDHEIEVRTEWGPLLDVETRPRARVLQGAEAHYAHNGRLLSIEHVFSPAECERLVAAAEEFGFGKTNYPKSYRGNLRLITVDVSLAAAMWSRLQALVPSTVELDGDEWRATGLNECWRLAKYHPGDRFGVHCDACFQRTPSEISMFTVNVYMNAVADGGATRFYAEREKRDGKASEPVMVVTPEPGLGVIFRQPPGEHLLHDGEALGSGLKYLFRTDIMYRRSR